MLKKRKVYLVIELDADEKSSILPPHLRGLVGRPLVDPLTTRRKPPTKRPPLDHWFLTPEDERKQQRAAKRKQQEKDKKA